MALIGDLLISVSCLLVVLNVAKKLVQICPFSFSHGDGAIKLYYAQKITNMVKKIRRGIREDSAKIQKQ